LKKRNRSVNQYRISVPKLLLQNVARPSRPHLQLKEISDCDDKEFPLETGGSNNLRWPRQTLGFDAYQCADRSHLAISLNLLVETHCIPAPSSPITSSFGFVIRRKVNRFSLAMFLSVYSSCSWPSDRGLQSLQPKVSFYGRTARPAYSAGRAFLSVQKFV
jgi:hypothetical protein